MRGGALGRRLRAMTLLELLVALAVMALLLGPLAVGSETTSRRLAHQEADRLARCFRGYFARSSRYRQDLSMLLRPNASSSSLVSSVLFSRPEGSETFKVDSRIKFRTGQSQTTLVSQYSWATRTVSPAFTLTFYSSKGENLAETLTVSVRGYITRGCSCGN